MSRVGGISCPVLGTTISSHPFSRCHPAAIINAGTGNIEVDTPPETGRNPLGYAK